MKRDRSVKRRLVGIGSKTKTVAAHIRTPEPYLGNNVRELTTIKKYDTGFEAELADTLFQAPVIEDFGHVGR